MKIEEEAEGGSLHTLISTVYPNTERIVLQAVQCAILFSYNDVASLYNST